MTRERVKMFGNYTGIEETINKFIAEEVQSIKSFTIDEQSTHARYVLFYSPKIKVTGIDKK